jgi:hypothetical protein
VTVDPSQQSIELTYQSIGEFIVGFQWVEDMYRQIGWFIIDPERTSWPPMQLRKESNERLIDRVTEMFVDLTRLYDFPDGAERASAFAELRPRFHALRNYRNRLLHSTFVEIKAGGEVAGYLRSNPRIGVDPDSGELIYDREIVSAEGIRSKIREYALNAADLGNHYLQLIHWSPFERFSRKA